MSTIGPKQALFVQFAAIAKTLGHGHRLELLEQMAQGERSVEILADRAALSIANASQHLQQMKRAGLVTTRRQGKFVYYQLADEGIIAALAALRRIAERNVAEVERIIRSYFNKRDELEPVSHKQLLKRIRAEAVTVLDVRPPDEFALGHLPGALNIPLRALKTRLRELDPAQEIVAYCRGKYCVLAFEAVALLRARGFNVRRLEDGFPEWRASRLPIVTGNA
ncbi:MAG: metalloregulator ArsR/SmtB family transcription factor [Rhizobiales bacterium]|nr:metalloregulator ArsR/SmtB family transcription factor [Hyphomicrobiales bacterium]